MAWGDVAQWAAVIVTILSVNAATVQWLLSRRDAIWQEREASRQENQERIEHLGKRLYDLATSLPLEYVRREDWIRFSTTIDAKIDSMREEIREELRDLRVSNG